MSVIVKGMEMPMCCDECPMFYEYRFCALTDDHASSIEWETEEKRMPNCPLYVPGRKGRQVVMSDALGRVERKFESCAAAARHTKGGWAANIQRACENNSKYMGHYWKYEEVD